MAKEYQEEEEARRRVFLQAAEEDQDKHLAASRIASLYQKMTAVKAVQELRLQAQVALADKAVQRFNAFSGVVQRMVRQHCTRGWFALWGIRFDPNRVGPMEPRGRKTPGGPQEVKISREDVVVRVGFEQQQRRLLQRLDTLFEIKKQYAELNALLSTNISHWKNRVACIGPEERKLLQFVVQRKAMHQDKIKQMTHPDHLRRLLLAVAATEQRVANLREIRALINLHLMSCYRRQAGLEGGRRSSALITIFFPPV